MSENTDETQRSKPRAQRSKPRIQRSKPRIQRSKPRIQRSKPRPEQQHQVHPSQAAEPRHIIEDITSADAPLYRSIPDRQLRHRALFAVWGTLTASLATLCVVAIATGLVPSSLVGVALVLACALMFMVRRV